MKKNNDLAAGPVSKPPVRYRQWQAIMASLSVSRCFPHPADNVLSPSSSSLHYFARLSWLESPSFIVHLSPRVSPWDTQTFSLSDHCTGQVCRLVTAPAAPDSGLRLVYHERALKQSSIDVPRLTRSAARCWVSTGQACTGILVYLSPRPDFCPSLSSWVLCPVSLCRIDIADLRIL